MDCEFIFVEFKVLIVVMFVCEEFDFFCFCYINVLYELLMLMMLFEGFKMVFLKC